MYDENWGRSLGRLAVLALVAGLLTASAPRTTVPDTLEWTLPARGFDGNRYVKNSQIAPANVARLQRAWVFRIPDPGMMEAAPIVWNGTVYVTSAHDDVYAIDAVTGAQRWEYQSGPMRVIAMSANRGLALADGKLFLGTLSGHVVALDAGSGRVLWDVLGVHDPANSFYTMAPIVFRDQVIIGVSNGDWGGIGYVTGFSTRSGHRLWEWQTIPGAREHGHDTWNGNSWARGGGAVWGGVTLDPERAILYVDVGNPGPDLSRAQRLGDNLYTNSMVALDISGRRPNVRWYHQFIAHDTHDWDLAMPPVRFTGTVNGAERELVAAGDKGGSFWVLDANDGSVLEHVAVSVQRGTGGEPSPNGTLACPGTNGGVQYNGGSYLPETNAFYLPSVDQCMVFRSDDNAAYKPGEIFFGGEAQLQGPSTGWMSAIDINTGRFLWRRKLPLPGLGGALALGSGLVFTGQLNGQLEAYDAAKGNVLWHFPTGSSIKSPPSTYVIDGRQYVVVTSGSPGRVFALPGVPPDNGELVTAFALPAR
jgi:alcohol dehydrogenase (cytochrome c)